MIRAAALLLALLVCVVACGEAPAPAKPPAPEVPPAPEPPYSAQEIGALRKSPLRDTVTARRALEPETR